MLAALVSVAESPPCSARRRGCRRWRSRRAPRLRAILRFWMTTFRSSNFRRANRQSRVAESQAQQGGRPRGVLFAAPLSKIHAGQPEEEIIMGRKKNEAGDDVGRD